MGVSRYNSEGYYALPFALVIACILVAAVATVAGATFPQTLIDDYILPMLNTGSTDFSALGASIARLACILAVGVAAAFGYNRIMVTVSQGTMRRLRDSADKANRYANLLMPINANIGWLSYVLVAIVGAVLGINGLAGVTLGTVVTFVGLNKSFTNPITQISMQVNFVVTAAAGAQRVFALMDQTPEADDGYVELVNAKENADGTLSESASAPTSGPGNTPTRPWAPSPAPSWKAAWCWTTWTSATRRKNGCCTTSACGPSGAGTTSCTPATAPNKPPERPRIPRTYPARPRLPRGRFFARQGGWLQKRNDSNTKG